VRHILQSFSPGFGKLWRVCRVEMFMFRDQRRWARAVVGHDGNHTRKTGRISQKRVEVSVFLFFSAAEKTMGWDGTRRVGKLRPGIGRLME